MFNRYIVHGIDADSKQRVCKVVEAPSSTEAEAIAAAIGVEVIGSEIDVGHVGNAAAHSPAAASSEAQSAQDETVLWLGHSSLWSQFWWFAGALMLVLFSFGVGLAGAFVGAWLAIPAGLLAGGTIVGVCVLICRSHRYTLTNQRLRLERGIIAKDVEELELYRVIDTASEQSVIQRLLGVGTVVVVSSDQRSPQFVMPWVHNPRDLREQIRQLGEVRRRWRKVSEIDIS